MKIKLTRTHEFMKDLEVGKVYDVAREEGIGVIVIDDVNENNFIDKGFYEVVEEDEVVLNISDIISEVNVYNLENAIKGSKYPMAVDLDKLTDETTKTVKSLASSKQGEGHDQFLTGIIVSFDLTLTNKAWVEAERYNFLNFISSQSTMHRISKFDLDKQYIDYVDKRIINIMNELKDKYNKTKDSKDYLKLLYSNPCGFKLTAKMVTNYRQLKTIYTQRKNHRLPEWRIFCEWIETLPKFKELILKSE